MLFAATQGNSLFQDALLLRAQKAHVASHIFLLCNLKATITPLNHEEANR